MGTQTVAAVSLSAPGPTLAIDANSRWSLLERARAGRITWLGPLLVVTARSILLILAQVFTALLVWTRSRTWSFEVAGKWWTVYGTLVDLGCLVLMKIFIRGEGLRLRDLISPLPRLRRRDLLEGFVYFLLVFPFFLLAAPLSSRLLYGSSQGPIHPGILMERSLPLWAVIYSLSVWWMIWSPTEEMTYQGYALPRFEVLCGRRWLALLAVGFWWALQHSFIPLILDWKYVLWRFLAFVPGVLLFMLMYLRTRRLPPLILAHWPMDISAVLLTVKF